MFRPFPPRWSKLRRWFTIGFALVVAAVIAVPLALSVEASTADYQLANVSVLQTFGNRLDWSHDGQWIYYERLGTDGCSKLWRATPSNSVNQCLTCQNALFPLNVGQPTVSPSGRYVIFQAQKPIPPLG